MLTRQINSLPTTTSELLSAFRKQAKLVEVLKRQRVHMEAAKTLEFVERDFLEALGEAASAAQGSKK